MSIPGPLAAALDGLPEDPRFERLGDWSEWPDSRWSFRFGASLGVPPGQFMPARSVWHLVARAEGAGFQTAAYPDRDEGIAATFPHQDTNLEGESDRPWRSGKPCLERPVTIFGRTGWADYDSLDVAGRIDWTIGRLFCWMDAAAEDRLLAPEDSVELPAYALRHPTEVIGFWEEESDLAWWAAREEQWGFASIATIPSARTTRALILFTGPSLAPIRHVDWSVVVPRKDVEVNAVWCRIPTIPVLAPWQAPSTWLELSQWADLVGVDLPGLIADAGAKVRRLSRVNGSRIDRLMLGFPLMTTMGAPAERMHWVGIAGLKLCDRKDVRSGPLSIAENRRVEDRNFATSSDPLTWVATANWAPDQLRKRGGAENAVRDRSVLVLGVGALGAAVAENLLRMGMTNIGIVDHDRFAVGNLSRHTVTMLDVGHKKVLAMSKRLNAAIPDAHVRPFDLVFPPGAGDVSEALRAYDVVVDCTASDDVLQAMEEFEWTGEKTFVSLAMTWAGAGMVAFSTSATRFPAAEAANFFLRASPRPDDGHEMAMEGIGCWHPIFPATADDVQLWAALGSKFVRRAVETVGTVKTHYVLGADGTVDRCDV